MITATHARRSLGALVGAILILAGVFPAGAVAPVRAAPSELFFSEYIEGSSNNKALEIYNGTGAAVNLGTAGYSVQMFFNGSGSAGLTINLTGTVSDGDVYVLAQSSADPQILVQADQTNGSGWFNGDDAVVLRHGTTIVDAIGQIGFDPGSEWGTGNTSTADNTLRRKAAIEAGDPNGSDVFDPSVEWDGFATNTFNGLGARTGDGSSPFVTSTVPTDGATGVAPSTTITINFSEPVSIAQNGIDVECGDAPVAASYDSAPSVSVALTTLPLPNLASCSVTVDATAVTDADTDDPPDQMAANYSFSFTTGAPASCGGTFTPTYAIQGSGPDAAITGTVTTKGVVVGDYETPSGSGQIRGFYIQDPVGDGNAATSDGLFVFNGNDDSVSLGQLVLVTGTASDFQDQTQVGATSVTVCGSGTVSPTDVTFPRTSANDLEAYEGMLVRLPQTMYVTEHFQLGRFGQVVVSSGDRLDQPTNIVAPGAAANALQAANNLNRIIIDDGTNTQNPDPIVFGRGGQPLSASNTLRGGDTATNTVGVMTYTWAGNSASGNAFRVRPINALNGHVEFETANPRPTAAPSVGGEVKVVSMNLLNYFNTFDGLPDNVDNCTNGVGGTATDCRGADTATEFARQWPKTVAAVLELNADVVAVNEIENDGYGPTSALADLVGHLNDETAPGTWAFIDVDAATGQVNALGTDAIKVGMLYKPAAVTPVGQTAALNSVAFVNGGDDAPRSRPALAQAFQDVHGARFIAVANHFKSKGSACDTPDAGDGQGNCNEVRVNAAHALVDWLATDPTGTGDPDVLILGDLNSYAMEDPVSVIKDAGYTNLVDRFIGADAYSYVFDGQWGYLDHALGSGTVTAQVTGVGEYHINADEPSVLDYNTDFKSAGQVNSLYAPDEFRISDHDPVVVGLDLTNCNFSDDTATETRSLLADCVTDETVRVPDGWTLDGDGHSITAVDPVGGHFVGAVVANEGTSANVTNLTVTASGLADACDADAARLRGILLDGASGSITNNRVIDINQGSSGCQEGNAIEVRNAPFGTGGTDLAVTIAGNEVTGYQKTGILANGSVAATITDNVVTGWGPTTVIAQNGIQVGFGATALVRGNTISGNFYTPKSYVAVGLLMYQADGVKQQANVFFGNEKDVYNGGRGGGSFNPEP